MLSKEDKEKALKLPEGGKLPMPKEIPWAQNKKLQKAAPPDPNEPKPIPAIITSLKDAQKICDALSPECRGVLEDVKTNTFLLRHGGAPRNLVVSAVPQNADGEKRYFFSNKNTYLKYCPGVMGYLQALKDPIRVTIENNQVVDWHNYKYVIDFTVSELYSHSILNFTL